MRGTSTWRVATQWLRRAGLLTPPPVLVEHVTGWVHAEMYEHLKTHYLDEHPDVAVFVHARPSAAAQHRKEFRLTPEILHGWPYLRDAERLRSQALRDVQSGLTAAGEVPRFRQIALLGSRTGRELHDSRDLVGATYILKHASPEQLVLAWVPSLLRVSIDWKLSGPAGGNFSERNREMWVFPMADFPGSGLSMHRLQDWFQDVANTVRHELGHHTQMLLKMLHGVEKAGVPSPRIRTPEFRQSPAETAKLSDPEGVTHALDDVEFYTRLHDEVHAFNRFMQTLTLPAGTEGYDFWVRARKIMVDDPSTPMLQPLVESIRILKPRLFFTALRKHAPGKWRKAVGEFLKATEKSAPLGAHRPRMPTHEPKHQYHGADAGILDMLENPDKHSLKASREFIRRYHDAAQSHAEILALSQERKAQGKRVWLPRGMNPEDGWEAAQEGFVGLREEHPQIGYFVFGPHPFFQILRKYAPDVWEVQVEAFRRHNPAHWVGQ